MERVLAFQAYQIDELNPASDRTLGFKCDLYNASVKQCTGNWIACRGSRPGGRCDFSEFLRHMGKLPNDRNWPVYRAGSTTRLDAEATAQRCILLHQTKNSGKPPRNFLSWQVLKGERGEFNHYIMRMADIVDETAKSRRNSENTYLWEDYDTTRDRTIVLRAGDHGEKLVAAARAELGGKMEIKTLDLGPHPTNPSAAFETLDWKATAIAAKSAGVQDYKKELQKFYNDFYSLKVAREHRAVNRSYKKTVDRARSCR